MSLSFTITPSAGGGSVSYAAVGSSDTGRFALDIDGGAPVRDLRRFRVPGMKGNYIVDGSEIGRQIRMTVRYIGSSQAACETYYADDTEVYTAAPQEIVADGETYSGCHLTGGRRLTKMRGIANSSGKALCDVEYTFSEDNPA